MTGQQWLDLKVGDEIIDHACGDAIRRVFKVTRAPRKHGARPRTSITVNNLKENGRRTIVDCSQDRNGTRFVLIDREQAEPAQSEGDRA